MNHKDEELNVQNNRSLVIGAVLVLIGLLSLLSNLDLVYFEDEYIGVLFLWGIAGLFSYGYLRKKENWGFLIPAGIFVTIGAMVLFSSWRFFDDDILGSIFFLGLGLTFGLLYLIRNEENKLAWAKIPAIGLCVFAGFIYLVTADSFFVDLIFPIALILVGGYLVYDSTRRKVKNA